MRELLAELTAALKQRQPCVYCAVVETRGSTPQKAGAAMLVLPLPAPPEIRMLLPR